MGKPLAGRIASARSTDRVTISDLERLIADATAERDRLSMSSIQASAESVNFALGDEDRDEAARLADRYNRTATGLAAEIEALAAKLLAKRSSEATKAREAERAAILVERDELGERLGSEWPTLEASMIELFTAIKANDARMAAAGIRDASAEAVARGCPGTFRDASGEWRRLTEIKLPQFRAGAYLAWPQQQPHLLALSNETTRQQRIRAAAEREAEGERWARYFVKAPADRNVALEERRGPAFILAGRSQTAELTVEGVNEARKSGCVVEIAKPGQTLGQPAAAAFLT